jgi:hypothetical protein
MRRQPVAITGRYLANASHQKEIPMSTLFSPIELGAYTDYPTADLASAV